VQFDTSNPDGNPQGEPSNKKGNPTNGSGDAPDKSAPVNGAVPLSKGHGDGAQLGCAHEPVEAVEADDAPQGETGQDETGADSGNSRANSPYTEGDGKGNLPSAKAHAEARERLAARIMTLYDVPPLDLEFNFDKAHQHLEIIGRANGRVLLQTFDNNKPRLKQVNEIAKDWNAIERKLAEKEGRHPKLLGDPLAIQPCGTLDQLEKDLMELQRKGGGVYIPFNLMRSRRRSNIEAEYVCGVFRENDEGGGPLPIEPTMTLATSPGKSHDWLLIGPRRRQISEALGLHAPETDQARL
jgi:hypothetical protein